MKLEHAVPGLVWIAIGGAAWGYSAYSGTPLILRGTDIPWGAALIGVGVIISIWGLVKNRRRL